MPIEFHRHRRRERRQYLKFWIIDRKNFSSTVVGSLPRTVFVPSTGYRREKGSWIESRALKPEFVGAVPRYNTPHWTNGSVTRVSGTMGRWSFVFDVIISNEDRPLVAHLNACEGEEDRCDRHLSCRDVWTTKKEKRKDRDDELRLIDRSLKASECDRYYR